MAIDENSSSSTGNLQDNLETMIAGIDPRVAEALPRIGIHRLADLAESTPGELAKALKGMGIYRKHIEVENWIGQAKQKLAERKIDASSSPQADTTAMPNTQASGNQLDDWNTQLNSRSILRIELPGKVKRPGKLVSGKPGCATENVTKK